MRTVTLQNEWMKLAYNIAKQHYVINNWNLKTTPVAVIVGQDGRYISHGSCADGRHAIHGFCNRLEVAGSSYENCMFCHEVQHAERLAIEAAGDKPLIGASIYIYGHYKVCEHCLKLLHFHGITQIYILENAHVLFDRHNPNTVLGKPEQFNV